MAKELRSFGPHDRLCGAEINSIASLIERKYAQPKCGLYFMHSETEQGRQVVEVLCEYYRSLGHEPVKAIEVKDLQDDDPRRFRTKGLRQLVKEISRIIRNHSPAACAINATGGYKAQIAVGVVLGQALGVTIYYKHEQFSEVISFPPLPVALDFELWMRASGMLMNLLDADPVPASRYKDEWDERYESLVERVQIDGEDYLELSPTGQIFHETFTDRFRSLKDHLLPPPASKKLEPRLEKAGWPGEHPEVEQFLRRITDEVPFVVQCCTDYFNPDLPEKTRFFLKGGELKGQFSKGSYTVKFFVKTTAETEGQLAAAMAALNEWLVDPNYFLTKEQVTAAQLMKGKEEAIALREKTEIQVAELRHRLEQSQRQLRDLVKEKEDLSARNRELSAQLQKLTGDLEQLRQQVGGVANGSP